MAGLAGCQALSGGNSTGVPAADPTETRTPEPSPTETPTDEPRYTTIVDLETIPRTYALPWVSYREDERHVTIEFLATATPEHPATVRATLQNVADYESTFRLEGVPPFGDATSTPPREPGSSHGDGQNVAFREDQDYTYRESLVLAPTADHGLVDDPPAVERDEDGLWRAADVTRWLPETVRLGPGESVEGTYRLVGHPDGAGRGRPTGVYEFTRPDSRALRVAVWHTDRPGPRRESRFAGHWVPSLPVEGSVAWFHEADAETPSYVEPDVERTGLPAAVSFTFVNHSREVAECGDWNFYKLADGEWFHLGPVWYAGFCRSLRPGGAARAILRAFPGEGLECGECNCDQSLTFEHLGGGRYAMVTGYGHATDRSAAMVAFDAPPTEVTPTDDVWSERDGETVTVTSERYGDGGDDRPGDATYETARVDSADDRLIVEQAMQRRHLRNTLAFFTDGVERVVLRTEQSVTLPIGPLTDEVGRFRFQGAAYEIRQRDEE